MHGTYEPPASLDFPQLTVTFNKNNLAYQVIQVSHCTKGVTAILIRKINLQEAILQIMQRRLENVYLREVIHLFTFPSFLFQMRDKF